MKELKASMIALDDLNLDPNNYRLRSIVGFKEVDPKVAFQSGTQNRTLNLISGKNNLKVSDLVSSFRSNGYLKVDNILVRELDKKYIVIEGNRRITALKLLKKDRENGFDLGNLDDSIFDSVSNGGGVECVLYDYDSDEKYLILMGLKHVSGNKKWDSYNQAKLLWQLGNEGGYDQKEIAAMIGLFKDEVTKRIRGYDAITDYLVKIEDYELSGDFNPHDTFMIFVQFAGMPKLREWGQWDEEKRIFDNTDKMARFYNWITPQRVMNDETEELEDHNAVINSHKQVRNLAEIINDEESLIMMEETGSFELALDQNLMYSKKILSKTLKSIYKNLANIKYGSTKNMDDNDKQTIEDIIEICNQFLKSD